MADALGELASSLRGAVRRVTAAAVSPGTTRATGCACDQHDRRDLTPAPGVAAHCW